MSDSAFTELLRRYQPEGKRVCNCGQAYETYLDAAHPTIRRMDDGNVGWIAVAGYRCEYGCSAAQYNAKQYVAECVVKELAK